jgi:hypothetical protein
VAQQWLTRSVMVRSEVIRSILLLLSIPSISARYNGVLMQYLPIFLLPSLPIVGYIFLSEKGM